MAVFRCKMCGGELVIVEGSTVCECEYCGTKQTLPKLTDDRRANLYDRANHFRRNNEFDKAMAIYEDILNEDSTDAEAYWSLVLCQYGIEYVEDPATKKRLPTVNRAQYTSIFADENYKSAIENADYSQKNIYESEAKAIDEIQKGILAISQKEEPFDVFICYKETDVNGRRTQDSVLAQELYYGLKNEGFKVFFSRITLEDKLGTAYEPYIFAALNSAKVMVVLGTRPEHFNAVWVKNEWSRYLSLIKQGKKKTLIPAYRDMDPYDLPTEFSHLQAQDMSKLGFMQDLVRGIKKILSKDEPKSATIVKETVVQNANNNVEPLLRRVFMFLEDEDWKSAVEYCEKVLDQDPENAQAYLGKLMAEQRVKKQEELKKHEFENSVNYQKIVRFGDEKLKSTLKGYIDFRNNQYYTPLYDKAVAIMKSAVSAKDFEKARDAFKHAEGWKDSDKLANECENQRKDKILSEVEYKMRSRSIDELESLIKILQKLDGWKNSNELIATAKKTIEQLKVDAENKRRDKILDDAKAQMNSESIPELEKIIETLNTIVDWKDASEQIKLCQAKISEFRAKEEALAKNRKLKKVKIAIIVATTLITLIVLAVNLVPLIMAEIYMSEGNYGMVVKTKKLTEFTVPDGVTELDDNEFSDCTTLKIITIPNSVTTVGQKVFNNCPIEKATVPARILSYLPKESLKEVTVTNGSTSVSGLVQCSNLTTVTLPDSVTIIGDNAFNNCKSLCNITIPNGVTSIGEHAFEGCSSLTKVTIPNSVTNIGGYAFTSCSNLTEITIPNGVTNIGAYTFTGCTSLTEITIPNGVTSIGNYTFARCENLTSITIPNSVRTIGDAAFFKCTRFTNITLSNSVTSIGDSAFKNCVNLTSITIPNSVARINKHAFNWCLNLTTINYCGSKEQWEKITKESAWNDNTSETLEINYNYVGK